MIVIDGMIFSIQAQGGISVYVRRLLDCLAARSVPATLTLEDPLRQEIDGSIGEVHVLRRRARLFERYRRCRLPAGTTLFHSSYYRRPETDAVPAVVTVHDFTYERYSRGPRRWVHVWQKHAAIRAARAIICVSDATREDLLAYVGVSSGQAVHVIPNGVAACFRPIGSASPERPFVLFVGERGGYKNFDLALRALALLPEVELHCVGGGGLRADELAGVPESVSRRVRHLGRVDDETLNRLYNQAVCLVYPSRYEGFGIPVAEAMRAGCPVVSVGCRAVMEVGGDALTIAERVEPAALAVAIARTMSAERPGLIERGLARGRRYSWEKTHAATLDVYRSLIG
jgi:mannosyltransferase